MSGTFDLLIRGGIVATPNGIAEGDIGVTAGKIAAIGSLSGAKAAETFDAKGLHVLPGVIDSQCHFREPGNAHKEDLESGSRAAVLGGVTGVFEMPNTNPPTTTTAAIEDKLARAKNRMHCDYAFYAGATPQNVHALAELEKMPGVCGVKGDPRSHPVWRDEETARASTERVLRLARQAGRRLHVLHVTTAEELPLLAASHDLA